MNENKNLVKQFLMIVAVLAISAGIVGAIVWFSDYSKPKTENSFDLTDTDYSGEWEKGASNAKVVLVEYSDFQCPACSRVTGLVETLLANYPGDLKIIYRHFPLSSIHTNAQKAAEAAEAAGAQGKFWEMHDLLFANQENLSEENLRKLASDLNLDISRFIKEMNENTYQNQVAEDLKSGRDSQVNATPTFFINGKMYQESYSLQDFSKAIEAALAS